MRSPHSFGIDDGSSLGRLSALAAIQVYLLPGCRHPDVAHRTTSLPAVSTRDGCPCKRFSLRTHASDEFFIASLRLSSHLISHMKSGQAGEPRECLLLSDRFSVGLTLALTRIGIPLQAREGDVEAVRQRPNLEESGSQTLPQPGLVCLFWHANAFVS